MAGRGIGGLTWCDGPRERGLGEGSEVASARAEERARKSFRSGGEMLPKVRREDGNKGGRRAAGWSQP